MAAPWTPEQADQLLAIGAITPDQHAQAQQAQPQAVPGGLTVAPIGNNVSADPFGLGAGAPSGGMLGAPTSPPKDLGGPPLGSPPPPAPVTRPGPSLANVKVEGGMNIIPKSQRAPAANDFQLAQQAKARTSPGYDRADVDAIAAGGAPRMVAPKQKTALEHAEHALGRPLTDKEKSDPALRQRLIAEAQSRSNAGVTDAQDRERSAMEHSAEIGKAKAVEEHAAMTEQVALQTKQTAELEQHESERRARVSARMASVEKDVEALAKEKIDGRRLFRNQSTGDKILAGVMTFFGAGASAAAARNGGQAGNAYTAHVHKLIEQDIEVQKANLANKKSAVDAKRGLLADAIRATGDEREAELLVKNKYLDVAKQNVLMVASKYKSDEVAVQSEQALAGLDAKKAENDLERNKLIEQKLNAERAAAAAAAAARAKEERDRRWELVKTNNKEAYDALQTAQKEGTAAPAWALKALSMDEKDAAPAQGGAEGGGLDKAGRQKMALERAQAQEELDSALKAVDGHLARTKEITKGGVIGEKLGHVGIGAENKANLSARLQYNVEAERLAGMIYKLQTGNAEPKNKETIEKYSEPYVLKANENEVDAQRKMAMLRQDLIKAAAAKGAHAPGAQHGEGAGKPAANDNADPYAKYKVK